MGGECGNRKKVCCLSRLQPAKLNYVTSPPEHSESKKGWLTLDYAEYCSRPGIMDRRTIPTLLWLVESARN